MATMNISLPAEMKAWVEEQVKSGRYSGASDVVRDLVRRGIARTEALATFNEAIDRGVESGVLENYDPEDRRRELRAAYQDRVRATGE